MAKKILIVEDEKNIATILAYNIKRAGYEVSLAFDGPSGLKAALEGSFDLVLLDVMLPEMDGFEVCSRLRKVSQVPVIFCTARESERDKIFGLDTGADDYVTKPFSINELLARIRVNIRRSSSETTENAVASSNIVVGDLVIDREHYSVTKKGEPVELSKKDYDILCFLAVNLGKAYSREELLSKVWGYDGFYGDIRTVDVTVCRLRNKLEDNPAKPEYLLTKRGVGYYLRGIE